MRIRMYMYRERTPDYLMMGSSTHAMFYQNVDLLGKFITASLRFYHCQFRVGLGFRYYCEVCMSPLWSCFV